MSGSRVSVTDWMDWTKELFLSGLPEADRIRFWNRSASHKLKVDVQISAVEAQPQAPLSVILQGP